MPAGPARGFDDADVFRSQVRRLRLRILAARPGPEPNLLDLDLLLENGTDVGVSPRLMADWSGNVGWHFHEDDASHDTVRFAPNAQERKVEPGGKGTYSVRTPLSRGSETAREAWVEYLYDGGDLREQIFSNRIDLRSLRESGARNSGRPDREPPPAAPFAPPGIPDSNPASGSRPSEAQIRNPKSEIRNRPRWFVRLPLWPFFSLARGLPLAALIIGGTWAAVAVGTRAGIEEFRTATAEEIGFYWTVAFFGINALAILAGFAPDFFRAFRSGIGTVLLLLVVFPILFPFIYVFVLCRRLGAAVILLAAVFLGIGLPYAAFIPDPDADLALPSLGALWLAGVMGAYFGLCGLGGALWMWATQEKINTLGSVLAREVKEGLVEAWGVARPAPGWNPAPEKAGSNVKPTRPPSPDAVLSHDPLEPGTSRIEPFWLDDPTGAILVDPTGATIGERGETRLAPAVGLDGLTGRNELMAGETVCVIGRAVPLGEAPSPGFGGETAASFRIVPLEPPRGPFLGSFDHPLIPWPTRSWGILAPPRVFLVSNRPDLQVKHDLLTGWPWKAALAPVWMVLGFTALGFAADRTAGEFRAAGFRKALAAAAPAARTALLRDGLKNPRDRIRLFAAQFLHAHPPLVPEFLPDLRDRLEDPSTEIRRLAAALFEAAGPAGRDFIPDLARMTARKRRGFLDMTSHVGSYSARQALSRMDVKDLIEALRHEDPVVREGVARACYWKGKDAAPALEALRRVFRDDPDPSVRQSASAAVEEIRRELKKR